MNKIISFTFFFLFLIPNVFAVAPLDPDQDGAEYFFDPSFKEEVEGGSNDVVQDNLDSPTDSASSITPSIEDISPAPSSIIPEIQTGAPSTSGDSESIFMSPRYIFIYAYIFALIVVGIIYPIIKRKKK